MSQIISLLSIITFYHSIFIISAFVVVGLGSWAFHMTLLYSMQLLDELPMVVADMILIYQLSEIRKHPNRPMNRALIIVCLVYCVVFTALYLILKDPMIHQVWLLSNLLFCLSCHP